MFDLLVRPLFTASECDAIVRELRDAMSNPATVYGTSESGAVDPAVRKTMRIMVSDATARRIADKLLEVKPEIETRFNVTLQPCEEPQFLRYRPGDYFVAHQDGNTSIIHDDTRHRRISVVVFLDCDGYEGGALVFHGRYPDFDLREEPPAQTGDAIFFPSETTHEVTPVTSGVRYTIVSWYRLRATDQA